MPANGYMARPRQPLDENVNEAGRVAKTLRERSRPATEVKRLTAVKLGFEASNSLQDIAEAVGSSVATVKRWFDAYRKGGVESLLRCERAKGAPGRFTEADAAALRDALARGNFRRAADVQAWLRKHRDMDAPLSSVYRYLGKLSRG